LGNPRPEGLGCLVGTSRRRRLTRRLVTAAEEGVAFGTGLKVAAMVAILVHVARLEDEVLRIDAVLLVTEVADVEPLGGILDFIAALILDYGNVVGEVLVIHSLVVLQGNLNVALGSKCADAEPAGSNDVAGVECAALRENDVGDHPIEEVGLSVW
jgi:hypothetical protein